MKRTSRPGAVISDMTSEQATFGKGKGLSAGDDEVVQRLGEQVAGTSV